MTNISAAIGVAQLERLASIVERKQAIATQYRHLLRNTPVTFQARSPDIESGEWLVSVLLPEGVDRDRIMQFMEDEAVETRPTFYCAHHMPMYATRLHLPRAEQISQRGLSLPSFPQMSKHDVERVTHVLRTSLEQYGPVTRGQNHRASERVEDFKFA